MFSIQRIEKIKVIKNALFSNNAPLELTGRVLTYKILICDPETSGCGRMTDILKVTKTESRKTDNRKPTTRIVEYTKSESTILSRITRD